MTKKEAIDLLDNLIGMIEDNHGSDYDSAIRMAIDALEPKWIPVSERLPDVGQKVLASTNKTCFTQVFKGTSGASNSSWWWEKKTIKHIVAWMPLPDPYKEDKT